MKSGAPRKAPKVVSPSKGKPNFMKESDTPNKRQNPQAPMKSKRLSK